MYYYKTSGGIIAVNHHIDAEEITAEEYNALKSVVKIPVWTEEMQARWELTRPRTVDEGMMALNRAILAEKLADSEDKTLAIACMAFFEPWTPGKYAVGDIRTNPKTGYPRECMTAHDSTINTDWTIAAASIWKPYHSRKREYALAWEQPTGSHDIYKAGEYMVWTDYSVYRCKADTNFSPDEYAEAWEKEEKA